MGALEVPALEDEGIGTVINGLSGAASDPIADLVAGDGAKYCEGKQGPDVEQSGGSEDAGSDQERITGQEKSNEKAGLNENDDANEKCAAPVD